MLAKCISLSFMLIFSVVCVLSQETPRLLPLKNIENNDYYTIPKRAFELSNEKQTVVELTVTKEGFVLDVDFVGGNEILANITKQDFLRRLEFEESTLDVRKVTLTLETDLLMKKLIFKPYNIELNIQKLKIKKSYPKHFKEGISECEIHHEILKKDLIKILYGLIAYAPIDILFYNETKGLFPNDNDSFLGGCVVQSEKFVETAYCPKCRAAKKDWNKKKWEEIESGKSSLPVIIRF